MKAGTNTSVSGSGSAANPYVISADVPCQTVRSCLSAGPGVEYNAATGVIQADISSQTGNNLAIRPDGLFVPTGAATVNVGCGLSGNGSASTPLQIKTGSWPYPCSPATAGGVIVCDANGVLRGEPRGKVDYKDTAESRIYNDVIVPTGTSTTPVDTFSMDVTNTDTCRPAQVFVEREFDVNFTLPAGAGAAYGADGDEMYYVRNTGTTTITNIHTQTTKVYRQSASLAPGATTTISIAVEIGRGQGGATYNRIQSVIRAIIIAL
ncbi:hypothetical protein [Streptomyces carpinensis]|uniref:Uncharacterized protein n=1 Tax=Streptomyces carpinensis TaxID=66369 RepID=A0ABV1W3X7_9ACTN|nr:hypothetical protein [Streptomyces carpinensis]